MYCGEAASHREERRVANPKEDPPDRSRSGLWYMDDIVALILIVLWVVIAIGEFVFRVERKKQPTEQPLEPPDTLVVIVTCEKHQNYSRWYTRIVIATAVVIVLGVAAIIATVSNEKLFKDGWFVGSLLGVIVLLGLFAFVVRSPLGVTALRDSVTVTGVSPRYFDQHGASS
jgi:hypothetical protein